MQSKLKDNGRMWLWWFLALIVMSQLYVVWELLAALLPPMRALRGKAIAYHPPSEPGGAR